MFVKTFRVLAEEWEKREELERLQEEQQNMLATETLKRKQFENLQKAKESELKGKKKQYYYKKFDRDITIQQNIFIQFTEAEDRIRQIEKKRQLLDEELRLARNKIRHSEESQQILEEKLMVNFWF